MRRSVGNVATMCGLAAVTVGLAAGYAWARDLPANSTRDAMDWPVSIAANWAADLYIGMGTDTMDGIVRVLSADGQQIGHWSLEPPPATGRWMIPYVAEAPDGSVYVLSAAAETVRWYSESGQLAAEWDTGDVLSAIAAGPLGDTEDAAVYTLRGTDAGAVAVHRWGPRGDRIGQWPVHRSTFDLSVGPHADIAAGVVYVADEDYGVPTTRGAAHITRHALDGRALDGWDLPRTIAGLDAFRDGTVWVGQKARDDEPPYFQSYDQDGRRLRRCGLPAGVVPVDLTVSPNTNVYLVVRRPDELVHPFAVLRYAPDCRLLAIWEQEHLIGILPLPTPVATWVVLPSPTATVTQPPPSPTPTGDLPDLFARDGRICAVDDGPDAGLFLELWIRNDGPLDAGPFGTRADSSPTAYWRLPGLPAGDEAHLEGQRVGNQAVLTYVDWTNEVAESDETNNTWKPTVPWVAPGVTATLPPPPTCAPTGTSTPGTPDATSTPSRSSSSTPGLTTETPGTPHAESPTPARTDGPPLPFRACLPYLLRTG